MYNRRKNVLQSHLINQCVHLSSDPAHLFYWCKKIINHSQNKLPGLLKQNKKSVKKSEIDLTYYRWIILWETKNTNHNNERKSRKHGIFKEFIEYFRIKKLLRKIKSSTG
jgi:hypothetical protein